MFEINKDNTKNCPGFRNRRGSVPSLWLPSWNKHDTIDAVAMCVNVDMPRAKPLFFLDYIATGKLKPKKAASIVKGVAEGCLKAGCALIGGETAEMPGLYGEGEYDIAGFCVGIVDKKKIIDGSKIKEGDLLIGIPSSGIHSNGYSLVRKVFFSHKNYDINQYVDELGSTLGEELLTPTRIYAKLILDLISKFEIKGISNITGGGFYENIPRMFPEGITGDIDTADIKVLPIFKLIQKEGNIDIDEMYATFNMGIGIVLAVGKDMGDDVFNYLKSVGESPVIIGRCVKREGGLKYTTGKNRGIDFRFGTNLQSLIDYIEKGTIKGHNKSRNFKQKRCLRLGKETEKYKIDAVYIRQKGL